MKGGTALIVLIFLVCVSVWSPGICRAEPTMVENNLFSADRKPTTDEGPVAEAAGRQPAQTGLPPRSVQLDGIFIRDDVRKALVRVSSQLLGEPKGRARGRGRGMPGDQFPYMTISEGESIGDFKVIKIDLRSISLEKDSQVYVISLFMDGKVVPPVTPLPAAPISPEPVEAPKVMPGGPTPEQLQQAGQQPPQPPTPSAPPVPGGVNQPPAVANPQTPPTPPAAPQPPVPRRNPNVPIQ